MILEKRKAKRKICQYLFEVWHWLFRQKYPQRGEGQFNPLFSFAEISLQTTIPLALVLYSLSNFELIWFLEWIYSQGNYALYKRWLPAIIPEMSGWPHMTSLESSLVGCPQSLDELSPDSWPATVRTLPWTWLTAAAEVPTLGRVNGAQEEETRNSI